MKNLILAFAFVFCTGLYAQEKTPVDKMEATTTTTTTVDKNGQKVILSKVKETTRKEQEIKTEQRGGKTVNGDKVDTPIKVTKTLAIDRDWDPFYDAVAKTVSYNLNGGKVTFASTDSGFLMSTADNNNYGEAKTTTNRHFYLTNINDNHGVGYFNNDGNFIIEYFDKDKNMLVTEIYVVGIE